MKISMKLIGENKDLAAPEVLSTLKARVLIDDRVAVYQNHALDSADAGRLAFLIIGPTRTFHDPPDRAPDSAEYGPGWKYLPVGILDLKTNALKPEQKGDTDG